MSSAGVRRTRSTDSRVGDSILDEDRAQIENEKIFKVEGETSSNIQGIANVPTASGSFLLKDGDVREGMMGNNFKIVEIIDDSIDVSLGSGNFVPFLIITPEGGVDDELASINPGTSPFLNQEIMLQNGNLSANITLKDMAALGVDIITPDGNDLILGPLEIVKLIFNQAIGGLWVVVWISSGGTGGGTGVSFPIRPPIDDRGVVTTNQTFILSNTTGHVLKLTLGANIDIIFNNFPIIDVQQQWEVEIIQDATAPFVITWPASVVNAPDPSSYATLGSTTIVVFRTNDAGATIRVGNTVTTTASVDLSQWATFPAVNDINFATFDGINIDRLLYDQAAGESLAATDVGTTSNANGDLLSNVITGGFHTFKSALVDIAQFDDVTGLKMLGTHVINMNKNIINQIGKLEFDGTLAVAPIGISIDFNNVSNALVSNVPLTTDKHFFNINNELMVSIFRAGANSGTLQVDTVIGNKVIQADEIIDLSTFINSSPLNGNIWLDLTTGLFQFRENGVTIGLGAGGGANTTLSNLVPTVAVNQDLLPDSSAFSRLIGDSTHKWGSIFIGQNASIFFHDLTTVSIKGDIGGLNYFVPDLDTHEFFVDDTLNPVITIEGDTVDFHSHALANLNLLSFQIINQQIASFGAGFGLHYDVGVGEAHDFIVDGTEELTITNGLTRIKSGTLSIDSQTINMGDQTTDLINFLARVQTTFLPSTTNARDIGSSSLRWREIFSNNVLNVSFSKFKKDIISLDDKNCLDICKSLDTIEFSWNDKGYQSDGSEEDEYNKNRKYVGFNADKLKTMLPNAVNGDMVYTNAVIGLLLGTVRHLESRILQLEK